MKILCLITLFFTVLFSSSITNTQPMPETTNAFSLSYEEKVWLSQNPTIVLASADDYIHLAFRDEKGNIKGFDADLIAQINKNLNINLTLKLYNGWESAYSAALKGEVDGILSLSHTKERESLFYFSPSYHHDPTYIITRKNASAIKKLSELNNKTIVTEKNSIINDIVLKEAPNVTILNAPDINEILEMVQKGKADSALLEGINQENLDALHLKIAGSFFTKSGEYTIGTTINKPILAKIITKGINSISKNQMQHLKDRWFDQHFTQSTFTEEELAYIKNTPVVKVGIENWAPMISTKDGKVIEGITAELLTRVIQISGLKTELISGSWNKLLNDFKDKKIDILPATYYTNERTSYGLYSDPYTQVSNTLYVTKDNQTIKSFSDLEHKTVAIQKGFATIDAIKKKFPNITIIETDSLEDAIIKVSNKEIDALFEAQIVAQNLIQKLLITNLKPIFQNSIEAGTLHIFSKKDDLILQSIINKSLKRIPPEEKNNIIDKWLHQDIKKNVYAAFTKNREPYTIEQSLIKGIEYDVTQKALAKSNISLAYEKYISREEMENALLEDPKLDIAVGAKQKDDAFFYSDILVNFENIVVSRAEENLTIQSIHDLKDKKIIGFEGAYKYLGKEYHTLFNPENRPETYTETTRQDEQIIALLNKKVDVIIIDKNIFSWYLKKLYSDTPQNYNFHTIFPFYNPYKVAFRDKNLRDLFNQNLQEMRTSGEYAEIFHNYLETDIESKTNISTLLASLVAKSIFTENMQNIHDIVSTFATLPYIKKIEIFNNENEFLVSHIKTESKTFMRQESFHHISHIPQKVGYVHISFDEEKLTNYAKEHTIIPHVTLFENLSSYPDIKETYKRLDFLDKLSFSQRESAFIKKNPIINYSSVKRHPFYMEDAGKMAGLDIDFLKIIEQKSGLSFQHIPSSAEKELYDKFRNNEIDLITDTQANISEHPFALLSNDFIQFRLAIISHKNGKFTKGLEELKGRIAVPIYSAAHTLIKTHYPHLTIIETDDLHEALTLVQQGKADACVGHEAEITYILQNDYPNLKVIGVSKESIPHVFATHPTHPELISIINKILVTIPYEQKQEIKDKWFKTKITTEVDYSTIYKIATVLIIIILLAIVSNQRLKYLVKEKTREISKLLDAFDKNVIAAKLDEKGQIIYVSEALCKISEYSHDELMNHAQQLFINRANARIAKQLKKAIISKTPWTGKILNISKSGKVYWTKTKLFQEYDEKGKFLSHTIISQDVTAEKEVKVLYKEIEDTQKEIIFKMGAIGEARSEETGQHVKRVAEYSHLIALHYGLSDEEANTLKLASPMHDIGKVAIADSILHKKGKLSDEEFEIIKTHAELGYDMLKNSKRTILKAAAIVAYEHHEKFDGTGYPRGLKGDEIHIYGRITAIADVFDALGNKRVYKEAWEDEKIYEFFRQQSGKHFDPELVDIFFTNIDKFQEIKNSFKDA